MNEEAESCTPTCYDKIMVLDPVAMDEALFLDQLESLKKKPSARKGTCIPCSRPWCPSLPENTS